MPKHQECKNQKTQNDHGVPDRKGRQIWLVDCCETSFRFDDGALWKTHLIFAKEMMAAVVDVTIRFKNSDQCLTKA